MHSSPVVFSSSLILHCESIYSYSYLKKHVGQPGHAISYNLYSCSYYVRSYMYASYTATNNSLFEKLAMVFSTLAIIHAHAKRIS